MANLLSFSGRWGPAADRDTDSLSCWPWPSSCGLVTELEKGTGAHLLPDGWVFLHIVREEPKAVCELLGQQHDVFPALI